MHPALVSPHSRADRIHRFPVHRLETGLYSAEFEAYPALRLPWEVTNLRQRIAEKYDRLHDLYQI